MGKRSIKMPSDDAVNNSKKKHQARHKKQKLTLKDPSASPKPKQKLHLSEEKSKTRTSRQKKVSMGWVVLVLTLVGVGLGVGAYFWFGAPLPIRDGEPFAPRRDGFIKGGTYQVPSVNIPPDVTVEVRDDLVLNISGDAEIDGELAGDCVGISILSNGNLKVTGTVDNRCADADAEVNDMTLQTDGGDFILGSEEKIAVVETSGDLVMTNDPSLEEWEFDLFPEQRSSKSLPPVCTASTTMLWLSLGEDAPATAVFSGEGIDPDGGLVTYAWDFGDGAEGDGAEVTHEYTTAGVYGVMLQVADDEGQVCEADLALEVVKSEAVIESEDRIFTSQTAQILLYDLLIESGQPLLAEADLGGSLNESASIQWDFGDGTTGEGLYPDHAYDTPGRYEISLQVSDQTMGSAVSAASVYVLPEVGTNSSVGLLASEVQSPVGKNYSGVVIKTARVQGRSIFKYFRGNVEIWGNSKMTTLPGRNGALNGSWGRSAGSIYCYVRGDLTLDATKGVAGGGNIQIEAGKGGDGHAGKLTSGGFGGKGGGIKFKVSGHMAVKGDRAAGQLVSFTPGNGGDGGDGEGRWVHGGLGGRGGRILIRSKKSLSWSDVDIQCGGDGGDGGDAVIEDVPSGWAFAGRGGRPGFFRLVSSIHVFENVNITQGNGGNGGDAKAAGVDGGRACPTGGDGGRVRAKGGDGGSVPGCYTCADFSRVNPSELIGGVAGHGGDAVANAGDGGAAGCGKEAFGGAGGFAFAEGGRGGSVGPVRCNVPGLNFMLGSWKGGFGGDAKAIAGKGGEARAVDNECGQNARAMGGEGGKAGAEGGDGGRGYNGTEGWGGAAEAETGSGGRALAEGGGCFGVCKDGGDGRATGGDAGDLSFVLKGIGGGRNPLFDGTAIYTLGTGGDAEAEGGKGGDCKKCPGENGGKGGDASVKGGDGGYFSVEPKQAEGGDAEACGGKGGKGASCCIGKAQAGGDGGKGGNASAEAVHGGEASKTGGKGGDGGDGVPFGKKGSGGAPGGMPGKDGEPCPAPTETPKPSPTSTKKPTLMTEESTEGVHTATPTPSPVPPKATEEVPTVEVETEEPEVEEEEPVEVPEPGSGDPPEITGIEFPEGSMVEEDWLAIEIPADQSEIKGWIHFIDPDGDLDYAYFTPLEDDVRFDPFWFYFDETYGGTLEGDYGEGRFSFVIWCSTVQRLSIGVTLMDRAENWSDYSIFTIQCVP